MRIRFRFCMIRFCLFVSFMVDIPVHQDEEIPSRA